MSYESLKIPFKLSEFVIDPDRGVPLDVCDKIIEYHIQAVLGFRLQKGFPIYVSSKSGYRNKQYEIEKDREPGVNNRLKWSEHTFYEGSKGAVDWTVKPENMHEFALFLCSHECPYVRVAFYEDYDFIHCDYYGIGREYRLGREWERVSREALLQKVKDKYGV